MNEENENPIKLWRERKRMKCGEQKGNANNIDIEFCRMSAIKVE